MARENSEDIVAKLLIQGPPKLPASSAVKHELWKSLRNQHRLLWQLREVLLLSIVDRMRSGFDDGLTPELLRELADELENSQELEV